MPLACSKGRANGPCDTYQASRHAPTMHATMRISAAVHARRRAACLAEALRCYTSLSGSAAMCAASSNSGVGTVDSMGIVAAAVAMRPTGSIQRASRSRSKQLLHPSSSSQRRGFRCSAPLDTQDQSGTTPGSTSGECLQQSKHLWGRYV